MVFGKDAAYVPQYVGICLDYLDNKKMTSEQLMHEALSIRLGADAQSPEKVVSFLYEQLTGAAPSAIERDNFVGWISEGRYSVDGLAVFASELALNPVAAQLTGMASLGLAYVTPL